jgi:ABC-type uncharacterized transport system permease subunit
MSQPDLMLLLAALAFAGGSAHAVVAFRAERWHQNRWHWVPMLVGLVFLTLFLSARGREVAQCPMKSVSDILVFIAWSMVLLYFLVGSAYRLSLQGVFTAPLVTAMIALAALIPGGFGPYPQRGRILPLVEFHAAVALVAYAAFAMAAVTGVMYLVQERLLKKHQIGKLFFQLPPIRDLGRAIFRLVLLGLGLLSLALALTFWLEKATVTGSKLVFAWGVWGMYAAIAVLMWRHVMAPRRMAWLAVAGFAFPFVSLWIIS